jgi:hypothetical protein
MTRSASLPIAGYRLDMPAEHVSGLAEFSQAEYAIYGRRFAGEKNYNAPSIDFLERKWKVALGTVGGKVYKIAFFFESERKNTAIEVSIDVMQYCQQRLGKPSEQKETIYIWDATDGNVVLQLGKVGSTYQINLFETSGSVRTVPPVSGTHTAEWRTVPAQPGYWHPINRGFTQRNAKFMCSECGTQIPLPVCPDCGCQSSQLGTSMALPGVFCEQCRIGGFSWKCPSCGTAHKTMLIFYYDIRSIKVRKKRFWE